MPGPIHIAGRPVGPGHPPYVVAELSANHNGSIQRAYDIMAAAAAAGADAIKLQTYRADTITLDCDTEDFLISDGLWKGRRLYELYSDSAMPWEWHADLFARGRELGLTVFSSPFDRTAVDLLAGLDAPAYKIASFELTDLPLIRYAARTGRPLIMSTGMASAGEIDEALDAARSGGCDEILLLHCVSGYPAPAGDYNLATMKDMEERFGVPVGLSDHTIDNVTAIAAVALGACMVEKHVTLDRLGGGSDDSFSLEPAELTALVRSLRTAHAALGRVDYSRQASEASNAQFRRSLYFACDLPAGAIIRDEHIRSVRPGFGLPPKEIDNLIGLPLCAPATRGTPVTRSHFQTARGA